MVVTEEHPREEKEGLNKGKEGGDVTAKQANRIILGSCCMRDANNFFVCVLCVIFSFIAMSLPGRQVMYVM